MKNTLEDLNNYLFEALENVMDAQDDEELKMAVRKGKVITGLAGQIVGNATIALKAKKLEVEYGMERKGINMPNMLESHE